MSAEHIEAANRTAIERVLASEPWLVGVAPAGAVVPGLRPNMILHAAPPVAAADLARRCAGR